MAELNADILARNNRVTHADYRSSGLTEEALAWIEHASIYHAPTPEAIVSHAAMALACQNHLGEILLRCRPGPDRTHALNHVRQARMWANSSIALEDN